MSRTNRVLLIFWAVLLGLSLLSVALNVSQIRIAGEVGPAEPPTGEDNGKPTTDLDEPGADTLNLVLAVITAVASAGGFITTTIFTLREDRRDTARYELEIENLRKEIEHKKLEIVRLKREQSRE